MLKVKDVEQNVYFKNTVLRIFQSSSHIRVENEQIYQPPNNDNTGNCFRTHFAYCENYFAVTCHDRSNFDSLTMNPLAPVQHPLLLLVVRTSLHREETLVRRR